MKIEGVNVIEGSARVIRSLGSKTGWAVLAKDHKGQDVPLDWSDDEARMRELAASVNAPRQKQGAAA